MHTKPIALGLLTLVSALLTYGTGLAGKPLPHEIGARISNVYLPLIANGRPASMPTPTATPTTRPVPTMTSIPSCPTTGAWSGTTDQGYGVSIAVSNRPACRIEDLEITILCPRFLWRASMGPVSVVDGHFEASAYDRFLNADVLVIGDFVSATQASGTWYSYSSCHGTWEASHIP